MSKYPKISDQKRNEILQQVFDKLSAGQSIKSIGESKEIPVNIATVRKWIVEGGANVDARYRRARELCADTWFDEYFSVIAQMRDDRKMWQAYKAEAELIIRGIARMSSKYDDRGSLVNIDQSKTEVTNNNTVNVLVLGHSNASTLSKIRKMKYGPVKAPKALPEASTLK